MKMRTLSSVDVLCEFVNHGLYDVLEDFIIRNILMINIKLNIKVSKN